MGRKRGGSGGEKKRERRGVCNHFHLMPPTFSKNYVSTCQNVKLFIVTDFDYLRKFSSSRGCPYIALMSRTPKGSPGLGFQPSKSCRFCQKNLMCLGTKVPRVSLFNAVRNKKLINMTLSSDETLVLADVVSSLGCVFASF